MLNNLRDNKGARKSATIVGRGIGSGKGKTCGSGHKGQKARTGVSIKGFEGGQMPLHIRLPKRGFNPINRVQVETVSVEKINQLIESGKINTGDVLNREVMVALGMITKNSKVLVKVLGNGELKHKVKVQLDKYSKSALDKIKKAGGEVIT
ncbi:MAG: 50S ribosomal protein L15 [Alphaproteobacteria bacterium]|nr:50S ribosomal protein L15 [Alphaproteobacteria bacterium]